MLKRNIQGNNVLILESSDLINSKAEIDTCNFNLVCRKEIRKHDWIVFKNNTGYFHFKNKRPYSNHALNILVEQI